MTYPGGYNSSGGNIVKRNNGEFIIHRNSPTRFASSTDGISWTATTVFDNVTSGWAGPTNIIRLQSGNLISIYQYLVSPHPDFQMKQASQISTDDGVTWGDLSWMQTVSGPYCTMNSKVRQSSSGRIFWATSTGGEGGAAEEDGGVGVWYSDNEGTSWQECPWRLDLATTGFNLQEAEVVELTNGNLRLICRSDTGYLVYSESTDNGSTWSKDIQILYALPATMCAFNTARDYQTGEIFVFWVYEDTSEASAPQMPRNRLALARTRNNMQSWEYLLDVDDFEGRDNRFWNLAMYLDTDYVFCMPNVNFDGAYGSGVNCLKVTRVERAKLEPYPAFPPLH